MSVNKEYLSKLEKLFTEYKNLKKSNKKALEEILILEIPELVYNSNAIENSTLTLEETESIIFFDKIKKDHEIREIYEAKNLANIIQYLLKKQDIPFSVDLILQLHKILLTWINEKFAGRFRTWDERVRVWSHLWANPTFVSWFIFELVEKYKTNKNLNFLENIAYFHAEFEFIHPFWDWNGRIWRILINKQLMDLWYPPIIIPNKNKIKEYYPLFSHYEKTWDFQWFTSFFALLLIESLHKRISILTSKKIITLNEWVKQNNKNLNSYLNKAKRQTIPAFRVKSKRMIDIDFEG